MISEDYLNELIQFEGKLVPRGKVIQELQQNPSSNPELIDRWLQGYDKNHKPITFSSGEKWDNPILTIWDNHTEKGNEGYRLYWCKDNDYRYCVGTEGECSKIVYNTIREAKKGGMQRFGINAIRVRG